MIVVDMLKEAVLRTGCLRAVTSLLEVSAPRQVAGARRDPAGLPAQLSARTLRPHGRLGVRPRTCDASRCDVLAIRCAACEDRPAGDGAFGRAAQPDARSSARRIRPTHPGRVESELGCREADSEGRRGALPAARNDRTKQARTRRAARGVVDRLAATDDHQDPVGPNSRWNGATSHPIGFGTSSPIGAAARLAG
jgi:hypothetical protein